MPHTQKGSSRALPIELSGLFVVVVVTDLAARLAVPASLLALSRGSALGAAVTAAVVSGMAVFRGIAGGLLVERTVARGWTDLTRAAVARPIQTLSSRSLSASPHPLMDAAFHTVEATATLLPAFTVNVLGLVIVTVYVAVTLGARWLFVGAAIAPVIVGVMALARRAFRREEQRGFEHFVELSQELDALLSAAAEVRGQGRDLDLADRVRGRAEQLAATRRRATTYSALLGLLPLGLALLAASGSLWQGLVSDDARAVAQVAVLGGTAVAFLLSGVRAAEGWVRSAPQRVAYAEFVGDGTDQRPDTTTATLASWRDELRVEGVGIVYPGAGRATPSAMSFTWKTGGLALGGDNGAGKTSFVHALLGMVELHAGTIALGDHQLGASDLTALRERVVFVPQSPYVAIGRSVRWHLELLAHGRPTAEAMAAALDQLGVMSTLKRHAGDGDPLSVPLSELSGGEQRRVHLARAFLSGDAELVVLDEPEASLDRETREGLLRHLEKLAGEKRVLLIAHDQRVIPGGFERIFCAAGRLDPASDA